MTKEWTEERRKKARERIHKNRPWERSTGPKTALGKKRSALNALKHGGRSRIWFDYVSQIMDINQMTVKQIQLMASLDMYEVGVAKELIKKFNKNNASPPTN